MTNGRLRTSPDLAATDNTLATLPTGTRVQILSSTPEWLQVAVPAQVPLWVHRRNLAATADPRRLRVTDDGVKIRTDSRINAPELTQVLARDSEVIWSGIEGNGTFFGQQTGDWYAVQVPGLAAWLHRSLVDEAAPSPPASTSPGATAAEAKPVEPELEGLWESVQADYEALAAQQPGTLLAPGAADSLLGRLEQVIARHPRMRVRLLADRMMQALRRAQIQGGFTATPVSPPVAPGPTATPETATEALPAATDLTQDVSEPVVESARPDQLPSALSGGSQTLLGSVENRSFPEHGVTQVLLAEDGSLLALLLPHPEANLDLASWHWRRAQVRGGSRLVAVADGVGPREVPLVVVEHIQAP